MPGILPMKVIKIGSNAQSRIAQACDRCRSKKIRCDGVRPCCSQCATVGFECKTSDKLSRRAFPRGYTESLEERVRSLEGEVRELKDLLDEKDEKIDVLSRIHSHSSQPVQLPSPRRPSTTSVESGKDKSAAVDDADEMFRVLQSPDLLGEGSDSYFAGTSSGRTFVEAFKHRLHERGRSTSDIDTDQLLTGSPRKTPDAPLTPSTPVVWSAPPRLLSDQLVNVFFQEWAPLFPVLHRPAFLTVYERYLADSDSVTDRSELAQLNLVFAIASLSCGTGSPQDLESFEAQYRAAIDLIINENTLETLQCLILAQIHCLQQGDLTHLLTYKGLSTTISARLGLHQTQKRFALGALTCETRKKLFWTLYTVDCFSSIILGLPKHIKDEDVFCEYPVDADDEYVTERGFQPTLPGEFTRLSSALALFRAARILSRVVEEVFPAKGSYELSLKLLSELSDELDAWMASLPPHLRLQFAQDKPSTGTISSRSPILSLAYHYIRALIQRPAICSSTLGSKASSALMAHASSCKHIVQILQLLEERGLSFSFCLSRDELLVLSGFGLLFQRIQLDPSSKMLKDNEKSIAAIAGLLDRSEAACAPAFKNVAQSFLPSDGPSSMMSPPSKPQSGVATGKPSLSRHNSDPSMSADRTQRSPISSRKQQLKALTARFMANDNTSVPTLAPPDPRRVKIHNISLHPRSAQTQSQPSLSPLPKAIPTITSRSEPALSPANRPSQPASQAPQAQSQTQTPRLPAPTSSKPNQPAQPLTNLDYLSFGNEPDGPQHRRVDSAQAAAAAEPIKPEPQPTDWEALLSCLEDGGPDGGFGAPCPDGNADPARGSHASSAFSEAAMAWNADLAALCQAPGATATAAGSRGEGGGGGGHAYGHGHAGSIWSFSTDDGAGSVDDSSATDLSAAAAELGSLDCGGDGRGGGGGGGGGEGGKAVDLSDLGVDVDFDFGSDWENVLDAAV